MRVDVHIERLVLDGVALTQRERASLPALVQRELHALLDGPSDGDRRGAAEPSGGRLDHIARSVATEISSALPPRGGNGRRSVATDINGALPPRGGGGRPSVATEIDGALPPRGRVGR